MVAARTKVLRKELMWNHLPITKNHTPHPTSHNVFLLWSFSLVSWCPGEFIFYKVYEFCELVADAKPL